VADLEPPDGEHARRIAPGKLGIEHTGAQARRVERSVGGETVLVVGAGEMTADVPERRVRAEDGQIEILHGGIADEVPAVGEVEPLPGDVGAERARQVHDQVERVEVATRAAGERPVRLARRMPVEASLDFHAERIRRQQVSGGAHVQLARVAERAVRLEEADAAVADDRGAEQLMCFELKARVDPERCVLDARFLDVDHQPARQELRRLARRRRPRAALHLNQRTAYLAAVDADRLQQQRRERDASLDALEPHMHQVMIDLHALGDQAVRHRAAHAFDLEAHVAELLGHVPHHELQSCGRIQHPPQQRRRRHQRDDHQGGGDDEQQTNEQPAAHGQTVRASVRS